MKILCHKPKPTWLALLVCLPVCLSARFPAGRLQPSAFGLSAATFTRPSRAAAALPPFAARHMRILMPVSTSEPFSYGRCPPLQKRPASGTASQSCIGHVHTTDTVNCARQYIYILYLKILFRSTVVAVFLTLCMYVWTYNIYAWQYIQGESNFSSSYFLLILA